MNCTVLIVGAGPTGLMMAHELARYGIKSKIIDKNSEISKTSKALIIQPRTLEIFDKIGMIDQIKKESMPMPAMNLHINKLLRGKVEFQKLDSIYNSPLIVSQSHTEQVLTDKLLDYDITVDREISLIDFEEINDKIICKLNINGKTEICVTDWLIGADGAHSQVRKSLDIPFTGDIYERDFIQSDLKVDWTFPYNEGRIFLNNGSVVAFIPMFGNQRYRMIYISDNKTTDEPTLDFFQKAADTISNSKISLSDPTWLIRFRLHHRVVPLMSKSRVFIAGDAAHIHSPVGGQGMNTGLQDAFNLSWKLAMVINKQADKYLLESYSEERQPVVKKIVNTTDVLFKNAIQKNILILTLRKFFLPVVLKRKSLIKLASENISQLKINYSHSKYVKNYWQGSKGIKAGSRLPNGILYQASKEIKQINLYDIWQDKGFTILLFAGKNSEKYGLLEKIGKRIIKHFGDISKTSIIVGDIPNIEPNWNHDYYIDPEYKVHDIFGADEASIYIVRPDGYIGFRKNKDLTYKSVERYFKENVLLKLLI